MSELRPGWLKRQMDAVLRDTAAVGGSWDEGKMISHAHAQAQRLAELAAVTKERDSLKAVLQWYADQRNYLQGSPVINSYAPKWQATLFDDGNKARDVLAKLDSGELRK